jgi:hypothetical protein
MVIILPHAITPDARKNRRAFQTTAYSKTRAMMIPDANTMIFGSEPGVPRRRVSLGNEGICANQYHGLRSREMKLFKMVHNPQGSKELNSRGKHAKYARADRPLKDAAAVAARAQPLRQKWIGERFAPIGE